MCTRAVCALAHCIEAGGVATLVIGLIPQHVDAMRPPRALQVPFELGQPLGGADPDLQRRVLIALLDLLARPGPGPVSVDYPHEAASAPPPEGWACPVVFPVPVENAPLESVLSEIRLLRPWFDLGVAARGGRTSTGTSGLDIEAACALLVQVLAGDTPVRAAEGVGDQVKLAAEDLKLFYLESALAQPGTATTDDLRDWFWRKTEAGALLQALRAALWNCEDKTLRSHARFTLVPRDYANSVSE